MSNVRGRGAPSMTRASLLLALAAATAMLALPGRGRAQGASHNRETMRAILPTVVMVMSVDVVNGKLQPVSSGSGTILSQDGSVLTNYHVVNNEKTGKLHDLFIIGRFRTADAEPEFVCAGKATDGKLKPNLDLALIKCELDMNGRPWTASGWPALPIGRSEDIIPGEDIWVIGYPDVGGSTINVTAGKVSGFSGEQGGAGRAFLKTDAAITHGNSGGTAVDSDGLFIGVPSAFRVKTEESGGAIATVGNVGLIRPVEHARDLIAIAQAGWTPREGDNSVEGVTPPPVVNPPPASQGVTVASRVVDAANGEPIRGAFVVVFKEGIHLADVAADQLDAQALTYGQTNERGEFTTNGPVPRGHSYTVAVMAKGYKPLAVDDVLTIGNDTPDRYDPWGVVRLDRE